MIDWWVGERVDGWLGERMHIGWARGWMLGGGEDGLTD